MAAVGIQLEGQNGIQVQTRTNLLPRPGLRRHQADPCNNAASRCLNDNRRYALYLIPDFWTATIVAGIVVVFELLTIVWIQSRYMDTPPVSAAAKVMLEGALVLAAGILIGNS